MGGGLWRDVGKGSPQAGHSARKAAEFKRVLKEDSVLLADIQAEVRRINEERNASRDTQHLHASEICKADWCPRATGYRITGAPAEAEAPRWNVAVYEEGHDIHDRYQRALWRLGKLQGEFGCESCGYIWWATAPKLCAECGSTFLTYLEVPIEDSSIRLIGRGDGLVDEGLVEVKSIGLGTIRLEVPGMYRSYTQGEVDAVKLFDSIQRPFPSHLRQIMFYLRARELRRCIVLYEYKLNQKAKEFVVRYQPHIIEEIVEQAVLVKNAAAQGKVVRRPEWAEEGHKTCKSCVYRTTCWGVRDGNVQAGQGAAQGEAKVRVLRRV